MICISFAGVASAAAGRIFAFVVDIVSIYEPLSNVDQCIAEVGRQYEGQAAIPGGRLARPQLPSGHGALTAAAVAEATPKLPL
jgi:hypothetical protein